MERRPRWIARVATMMLLVGCTAPARTVTSTLAPTSAPDPTASAASPMPAPPASASDLPGSLLVRTSAYGLRVVSPDGARTTSIVEGSAQVQVLSAAWAPDGRRIAWSEAADDTGRLSSSVSWSAPDGSDRSEIPVPFAPFYLSWDPTSKRVAFLGGEGPLTLGVMERTGGETTGRSLATGQPFFFSWAPDGDRMLTHVAGGRLDTLVLDGGTERIDARTGIFQAPSWTPDGATQVYVARQGLVARDVATGRVRALAPLHGGAYLVVSPDERWVAFHARGKGETDFYDVDRIARATDLGVRVVPLAGGKVIRVTRNPAIAWSWSPDGSRLAILEPVYGDGLIRFRWVIWDGEQTFAAEPFVATVSFQQEMGFFSQYAQSSTMWAPDGSAFAYAADLDGGGGSAVWIQPVRPGAAAFPVAPGMTVAWSPAG